MAGKVTLIMVARLQGDLPDRTIGEGEHLPSFLDPQRMQKTRRRHSEEETKLPVEMG